MYRSFKGTLYVNNSIEGLPASVTFEFDRMSFSSEYETVFKSLYSSLKLSLGGYEERLVKVETASDDGELLVFFVDEIDKRNFLEECLNGGYGISRTVVEDILRKDKKASFFSFLTAIFFPFS